MILLRCRLCQGTGKILNEQYKICQALKSHDTKKYFHIPMEDEEKLVASPDKEACKNIDERVECPVCEGAGTIAFDEDEWDLQVVADDEDTGVEE